MELALLDTSFVVALLDERDSLHAAALPIDARVRAGEFGVLLPDLVVMEAAGTLMRRSRERKPPTDYRQPVANLYRLWFVGGQVSTSVHHRALFTRAIRRVLADGNAMNAIDAMLVEYMLRKSIKTIISFDKHFDGVPGLTRVG